MENEFPILEKIANELARPVSQTESKLDEAFKRIYDIYGNDFEAYLRDLRQAIADRNKTTAQESP